MRWIAIGALMATGARVPAQVQPRRELQLQLEDLAAAIERDRTLGRPARNALRGLGMLPIAMALADKGLSPAAMRALLVEKVEEARTDKQVGGGASSAGSTSLASKGSVPAILGLAVENGALSRAASGTTLTFRGNLIGMLDAMRQKGFIEAYDADDKATRWARRLSFAVSFDANRGQTPGVFTGDRQQVSSYGFRADIVNRRDPRHPSYAARWKKLMDDTGQETSNNLARVAVAVAERDAVLKGWLEESERVLDRTEPGNIAEALAAQFGRLRELELPPARAQEIQTFGKSLRAHLASREAILSDVRNGAIVTFEYTNTRAPALPDQSTFKLIAEGNLGKADLTANASWTVFNKTPAAQKLDRLRDIDFVGQLDYPLGLPGTGLIFTAALGYRRLMQDISVTGAAAAGPRWARGDNVVGQMKLTIPVKGSGVRIPLAFSVANRPELVIEKKKLDVRGQIGMTFDLDALFAKAAR